MLLSRTFISFFIFGLINNVLYVVILTAAHDLVPPTTPKSLVLLADILPAFLLKLCLPLFVTKLASTNGAVDSKRQSVSLGINYPLRLAMIVLLSSVGIILTSLPVPLFIVLGGVVLASLSSGLGETTFLQLSHYYSTNGSTKALKSTNVAIHGWSSGTGGAGLVGAGLVLVFTTIIKVPIDWVLRCCALMPFFHLWVFYGYLPAPTLNVSSSCSVNEDVEDLIDGTNGYSDHALVENPALVDINCEAGENLSNSKNGFFAILLPKIRQYFFIYMLPLSVVYFAEYVINQGVAPTMLFPLTETPFTTFRDSYVAYGTIYQVGVFISRSSGSVIRLKNLYLLGLLQVINLAICILQSIFMFMPSIWIVFIIILYEGLLGGAGYVNTFMSVSEEVQSNEREFALGCVGISDSFGIVMAAGISLWLEPTLCHFQVDSGRDWCTLK